MMNLIGLEEKMKVMKTVSRLVIMSVISFFLIFFSSCKIGKIEAVGIIDDQVRNDFLAEYPHATISQMYVGEGDFSAAYYHIKADTKSGGIIEEHVWQYLYNRKLKKWGVNHKEILK